MAKKTSLTFFGHLEELRKRILIALSAVAVGTFLSYFYCDKLLKILMMPMNKTIDKVYFFSPAEAFLVKMKVAFLSGVFLASPVVISQIWFFISPALYKNEKKIVVPLILITSFLFLLGAVFCFYFVLPFALKFLVGQETEFLQPVISVGHYISFLSGMLLSFGLAFNVPVFILALVFLGVLSSKFLNRYQRHAVVLIFIAAAVLTPGPDIASQLFLAFPLLLLFELSVAGAKVIEIFKKNRVQQ